MNIKIFEDQTGNELFPVRSFSTDTNIVKFFDNKIDLYVTKEDLEKDFLDISCYALIRKGQERPIGCYILGGNKYEDNVFTSFKNDAINALNNIGFKLHSDSAENDNAIFDGLEKFDLNVTSKENTDKILEALDSKEKLSYNAGDITDIAVFCRQMLKTIKTIKIAISTGKTNLGDINILRSKTGHERWSPTKETKDIFDKIIINKRRKSEDENNKRIEEDKKQKGGAGDNKIVEGKKLINDGLTIKRNAGIDTDEDVKRIYTDISGHPLPEKSGGIGGTGLFVISIAMLVFGIVIGMVIIPSILHKTVSSDVVVTPVSTVDAPVTTAPIVINTPVQTESLPTDNNTTEKLPTDNNTTENKTKALMEATKNDATTISSTNGTGTTGNPSTNVTANNT